MVSANRYIALLMVIGMLLQINVVLGCYGFYYLNRKAIAVTACEKKVRHCNGHCFLKKKIAEATDAPVSSAEQQRTTKTLVELLDAMPGMLPGKVHSFLKNQSISSCAHWQQLMPLDGVEGKIDHPPNT